MPRIGEENCNFFHKTIYNTDDGCLSEKRLLILLKIDVYLFNINLYGFVRKRIAIFKIKQSIQFRFDLSNLFYKHSICSFPKMCTSKKREIDESRKDKERFLDAYRESECRKR